MSPVSLDSIRHPLEEVPGHVFWPYKQYYTWTVVIWVHEEEKGREKGRVRQEDCHPIQDSKESDSVSFSFLEPLAFFSFSREERVFAIHSKSLPFSRISVLFVLFLSVPSFLSLQYFMHFILVVQALLPCLFPLDLPDSVNSFSLFSRASHEKLKTRTRISKFQESCHKPFIHSQDV